VGLIAAAQPINKVASLNWRSIASQNYFDKHGLFISLFWSGPLMVVALVGLVSYPVERAAFVLHQSALL